MSKQRLDKLLVELDYCTSRQQAQKIIRAGEVKVNDQLLDKPSSEVNVTAKIEVREKPPYVSRGGEKLKKALDAFSFTVEGKICLDGGISTGGFTDCLLQHGASLVYGVDVGYGQVDWKIRTDSRVILKERTNFRYLTPEILYNSNPQATLGVMDLSFISLTKVLETLWDLLETPKEIILLVKPQFEVGKSLVGKKGVVKNPQHQAQAIFDVLLKAQSLNWYYQGLTESPIKGPAGNREFLLWLSTIKSTFSPSLEEIVSLITLKDLQG
jgi:23S rRNA (cytidine1920-2'-O)/16S rRNA (cytidine1409-2'-O)-methyltransferase